MFCLDIVLVLSFFRVNGIMCTEICSFPSGLLISFQERENLASLERKYSELTGGQAFPLNPVSMKEVTQTISMCKKLSSVMTNKDFQY